MKLTIYVLLSMLCWLTTKAEYDGQKEQIITLEQLIGHPEVKTLVDDRNYQFFFVQNLSAIDLSALFPSVPIFQTGGIFKPQIPHRPQAPHVTQIPHNPPASTVEHPTEAPEFFPEPEHQDGTADHHQDGIADDHQEMTADHHQEMIADHHEEISLHLPETAHQGSLGKVPGPDIGYEVPCGKRAHDDEDGIRIVGGTNALPAEFPWQVSIQLKSAFVNRHVCGGSLLSKYYVVTAAHCVAGLQTSLLSVVAGDHDIYKVEGHEQRSQVSNVITKGFIKDNFTNDIALLQVNPPFKLDGKWTAPLCIPKPNYKFTEGLGVVTGWGRLRENGKLPNVLQVVALPLVPKPRCDQFYRKAGYGNFLNKCQLCSGYEKGGKDSCQGDSGGPLACKRSDGRYYLCGVVSWGVGCARAHFPGVYTQVSCYYDWIRKIIYARSFKEIEENEDVW